MSSFDAVVVGGGPVGLTSALLLAKSGLATALVTQSPPPAGRGEEARTAALFTSSIALLDEAGVWTACASASAPLTGIRILDGRGGLLRAPEVLFAAAEAVLAEFGYNVPNAALAHHLRTSLDGQRGLTWFSGRSVAAIAPDAARVAVTLDNATTLAAPLVVAADGRSSPCRTGAGIGARDLPYDQVALTAMLGHQRPHGGISTEIHGPAGPCTTVPMPGNASSLVWVERTSTAKRLMQLPEPDFCAALSSRLGGVLGRITSVSARAMFPLRWMQADTVAARRVMLVGEAAHVMPPLGAQGLNLGLRDVGWMAEIVGEAHAAGRDIGAPAVLQRYAAARADDIGMRMTAVDALNRSLLSAFAPVHWARGLGLHAMAASKTLRRQAMANGLAPPSGLPRAMRAPAGHGAAA